MTERGEPREVQRTCVYLNTLVVKRYLHRHCYFTLQKRRKWRKGVFGISGIKCSDRTQNHTRFGLGSETTWKLFCCVRTRRPARPVWVRSMNDTWQLEEKCNHLPHSAENAFFVIGLILLINHSLVPSVFNCVDVYLIKWELFKFILYNFLKKLSVLNYLSSCIKDSWIAVLAFN